MKYLDVINACFEAWGAVMIWLNFRRLLRDRVVRGVDWRVTVFYGAWGLWNLVYYRGVGHYLSAAACLGIASGNIAWVVLAIRCMRAEKREEALVAATLLEIERSLTETAAETHTRHYKDPNRARPCMCATCKHWRST